MTLFQPKKSDKTNQSAAVTPIAIKGGVSFSVAPVATTEIADTEDVAAEDFAFDDNEDEIEYVVPEGDETPEGEISLFDDDDDEDVVVIDDNDDTISEEDDEWAFIDEDEDDEEEDPDSLENDTSEYDYVLVLDGEVNTSSLLAYYGTMERTMEKLLENKDLDEETRRMLNARLNIYKNKKKEISSCSTEHIFELLFSQFPELKKAYDAGDDATKEEIEKCLRQRYIYEEVLKQMYEDKEVLALMNFDDVKKISEYYDKEYDTAIDAINNNIDKIINKYRQDNIDNSNPENKPETDPKTEIGSEEELDFDQYFDASSIKEGYVSAYAGDNPIKLYTDLGHKVRIGKDVTVNGVRYFALFQEDGTGYAWVKADDVLKLLKPKPKAEEIIEQPSIVEKESEQGDFTTPPNTNLNNDEGDEIETVIPEGNIPPEGEISLYDDDDDDVVEIDNIDGPVFIIDEDEEEDEEEMEPYDYDEYPLVIDEITINGHKIKTNSLFGYYTTIINRIDTYLKKPTLDEKTRTELTELKSKYESKADVNNYDIEEVKKYFFSIIPGLQKSYDNSNSESQKEVEKYLLQLYIRNQINNQIEMDSKKELFQLINNDELQSGIELLKDEYNEVNIILNDNIREFILKNKPQKEEKDEEIIQAPEVDETEVVIPPEEIEDVEKTEPDYGDLTTEQYFDLFGSTSEETYGSNQRMFRDMILYEYKGKKYTADEMKKLKNKAKEKGETIPHFTPVYTERYKKFVTYLENRGFTEEEAYIILSSINNTGICSYASTVDTIFEMYQNNESGFEALFGYPMYEIVDGKKVLNGGTLILDLWIYANDKANGGKLIKNGHLLKSALTTEVNPDGTTALDTEDQTYLSTSAGVNDKVINGFIKTKNSSASFKSTPIIYNDDQKKLSDKDIDSIKKGIDDALSNGSGVRIDGFCHEEKGETKIHLFSLDPTISDDTIHGHAMCVIGYDSKGIIVATWGSKYRIPWDDLKKGARINIYKCNID